MGAVCTTVELGWTRLVLAKPNSLDCLLYCMKHPIAHKVALNVRDQVGESSWAGNKGVPATPR